MSETCRIARTPMSTPAKIERTETRRRPVFDPVPRGVSRAPYFRAFEGKSFDWTQLSSRNRNTVLL